MVTPNKMFILQLGYRRNKLTEVEDNMAQFEVAYQDLLELRLREKDRLG